ncbi:unnamed protein product [Brassica rapa]|uniref:Uncharacterized protein n=1 Tax=Brassica campestris TaxID=3711 RepID=A0A8D9M736_BRACM|nr:unnamed protein product [Brassica rapa]
MAGCLIGAVEWSSVWSFYRKLVGADKLGLRVLGFLFLIYIESYRGSCEGDFMPRVMADQLSLETEFYGDSFDFVECSKVDSGGIVRNLQVQIDNALI